MFVIVMQKEGLPGTDRKERKARFSVTQLTHLLNQLHYI